MVVTVVVIVVVVVVMVMVTAAVTSCEGEKGLENVVDDWGAWICGFSDFGRCVEVEGSELALTYLVELAVLRTSWRWYHKELKCSIVSFGY